MKRTESNPASFYAISGDPETAITRSLTLPKRTLANPQRIHNAALRLMWANHLLPHIRSVLAVSELFSDKITLEELALLANDGAGP
ncbi:hypothetical protein EVAR_22217_1 [Eumeta japonica]|uniref:Uncharacterized protein n=1 Tax=Eumeta variegata TaxID=151549 RepID=A0A4C1UAL8_EUMVA|nr:hypothetical protein EVAR_22217_1 [Eumeta japonica]